MKKTGSKLVLGILAAVFAALSFVGFALPYMALVITMGNTSKTTSISRKDWNDSLKQLKELSKAANINDDGVVARFAGVLQIIAVVLLVAILALVIVNLFVEHKALVTSTKTCAIIAIILLSLFVVVSFFGGVALSKTANNVSAVYVPYTGVYVFFIFGLVSSILSLVSIKKAKAK